MFSAFQSNAFQRNAFQIMGGGVTPTPDVETKGGFDERDYHKYRKHLERVMEVAQEAEKRKYITRVKEDAEALIGLPVETEEISKILKGPQLKGKLKLTPDIDFNELKSELLLIEQYLNARFRYIEQLREQDDEAAFLLLLQ